MSSDIHTPVDKLPANQHAGWMAYLKRTFGLTDEECERVLAIAKKHGSGGYAHYLTSTAIAVKREREAPHES